MSAMAYTCSESGCIGDTALQRNVFRVMQSYANKLDPRVELIITGGA